MRLRTTTLLTAWTLLMGACSTASQDTDEGDTIEVEVKPIGTLSNPVVGEN